MTAYIDGETEELVEVLSAIVDVDEMHRLLHELMSSSEMDDLVKRWRLMEELMAGKTQRTIAAELGVSLCKITRGSKILKQEVSASRDIIKQRKVE